MHTCEKVDAIFFSLCSLALDPHSVTSDARLQLVPVMLADLVDISRFDVDRLLRFTLTVCKNYRPTPTYHNWVHAFCVAQSVYAVIMGAPERFTEIEVCQVSCTYMHSHSYAYSSHTHTHTHTQFLWNWWTIESHWHPTRLRSS